MTLMACYGAPHSYGPGPAYHPDGHGDQDGDGHPANSDCNDYEAKVYPGAAEQAGDAVDSDCDGSDDPKPSGFAEPPPGQAPALEVAEPPVNPQ